MEPASGRVTAAGAARESAEFFIPDLCASRSVFVMILLAELVVVLHVLAISALPQFNWTLLATGSFIAQWVVLLSAALLCLLRVPLSSLSLPAASCCSLVLVLLVTVACSYIGRHLCPAASSEHEGSWWLLRNVLVALVLAGMVLRYFYLQQQLRHREKLALLARMDSLRDRIRPHFLFNTLNSIASLIASRPEAAEQAVEDLSELFRVNLQDDYRSTTVADELHLCELYLDIEKLRLGERLQVEWQVSDAARQQPMPCLVLQPLVENAVYHGVSQMPQGGTVRIAVQLTGTELRARVENPLPATSQGSQGHKLALANIQQRLEALYGPAGRLQAAPEAGVFRVELSYPREVLV